MAEDVPLALYLPAGLFLKPDPKVTIEVKLPDMKHMGVSVSNWEVMEKIRVLSLPEMYVSLRVVNYSRDIVHFEGELESTKSLRKVLLLIDKKSIKLSGFSDLLKVKVRQKEVPHPSKQEWENYFADRGMEVFDDERPGERPDTVHIRGLPAKWFVSRTSDGRPCPRVLIQAFQKFGGVREVGIYEPSPENPSHFSSFGPGIRAALHFEAFIQYEKYSAFCNAMQCLKGMKLIRLEDGGKEGMAIIQADFDRGGYLTNRNIRKRRRAEERQQRMEEEEERRENERLKKEEVQQEELKRKEEEEKAQKKARKVEAKQKKRDEQEKLVAELKAVAVSRREEAQRLLRVLLAGAAETK